MDRANYDCYRAVRPCMGSSPQRGPAWFMRRGQTMEYRYYTIDPVVAYVPHLRNAASPSDAVKNRSVGAPETLGLKRNSRDAVFKRQSCKEIRLLTQCVAHNQEDLRIGGTGQDLRGSWRVRWNRDGERLFGLVTQGVCSIIPRCLIAHGVVLLHVLPVQFKPGNVDWLSLGKVRKEVLSNGRIEI